MEELRLFVVAVTCLSSSPSPLPRACLRADRLTYEVRALRIATWNECLLDMLSGDFESTSLMFIMKTEEHEQVLVARIWVQEHGRVERWEERVRESEWEWREPDCRLGIVQALWEECPFAEGEGRPRDLVYDLNRVYGARYRLGRPSAFKTTRRLW